MALSYTATMQQTSCYTLKSIPTAPGVPGLSVAPQFVQQNPGSYHAK